MKTSPRSASAVEISNYPPTNNSSAQSQSDKIAVPDQALTAPIALSPRTSSLKNQGKAQFAQILKQSQKVNSEPLASNAMPDLPDDIRAFVMQHQAERRDKNQFSLKATEIIIQSEPGRTYQLQYGPQGKVGDELGRGSYGRVRTALRQDGTLAAIKKYAEQDDKPYHSIRDAEHEYSVYKQLGSGSHFSQAYDIAHTLKNGKIKSYIFMELMEGKEGFDALRAIRKDSTLSANDARKKIKDIVRQYLEAVADMHEKGVVHGDAHPGNMFHEPSGNIKIFDFGYGFSKKYPIPLDMSDDSVKEGIKKDHDVLSMVLKEYIVDILGKYVDDKGARNDVKALKDLAGKLESGTPTLRKLLEEESYFTAASD